MSEEIKKDKVKWYYNPVVDIMAVLILGPFALPLVWRSPSLKKWAKVLLTAAVVILTILTIKYSITLYNYFLKEMQELQGALQ